MVFENRNTAGLALATTRFGGRSIRFLFGYLGH